MCLASVGRYKLSNNIGYKEFLKNKGHTGFKIRGTNKRIPIGKWLKEKDYRSREDRPILWIHADSEQRYHPGFHFYLLSDGGVNRRKIKFRKVIACGWQHGEKVVVAEEIFIFPLGGMKK